ncbi:hypothetical protein M0812_14544 [Anaeramoeba flamelloides]|uniref:Uncharacterized protein n=1 Tax=Anaeramoeba flamelloides TaxID=1746091 RepID=A0AAV7ZIW0_9EUKA|nr:hypothetical protein M0812_14544 [Anaeramoeba flamelloides]
MQYNTLYVLHTYCISFHKKLMESFPNINGLCKLVRVFFKRGIQAGPERWGKIMDFLNKIRRYKPRWEDANRIIYTHFYLCPEHIKPLIEDENKLCDKMQKTNEVKPNHPFLSICLVHYLHKVNSRKAVAFCWDFKKIKTWEPKESKEPKEPKEPNKIKIKSKNQTKSK